MFREVRHRHTGHLLFRYDPERDLVEIKSRGACELVDLSALRVEWSATPPGGLVRETRELLERNTSVLERP